MVVENMKKYKLQAVHAHAGTDTHVNTIFRLRILQPCKHLYPYFKHKTRKLCERALLRYFSHNADCSFAGCQ